MAAYARHALNLGYGFEDIYAVIGKCPAEISRLDMSVDELFSLVLGGRHGFVKAKWRCSTRPTTPRLTAAILKSQR